VYAMDGSSRAAGIGPAVDADGGTRRRTQFKAHWPPPGSPGFALPVFDLYRDVKETKPLMATGMWSVQYFADMRARHMAMKKRYPDRKETRGKPYGGIANLRPETKALLEYYYSAQKAAE
jgi:hypothetical protein